MLLGFWKSGVLMFLSDIDLEAAIKDGRLIVDPPTTVDPTSIDLHLDEVGQAKVWDHDALARDNVAFGRKPTELAVARMSYGTISRKYLKPPPLEKEKRESDHVFRRDDCVVLRPMGFLLWQTRERVGTPEDGPELICFIDGKSTRARTGLVVHLTAPTIHSGWSGNITLEMVNFGPLDLVLHEGDSVSQIVVAQITQSPGVSMRERGSATIQQESVSGANEPQA